MQIKAVHIQGFGVFSDVHLEFDPELNLIFGANGTGKTTFLWFLRACLFGFEQRGSDTRYDPVRGGVHGGSIEFVDKDTSYLLKRVLDQRSSGTLSLYHGESGEMLDPTVGTRLLGGITQPVFHSVFAFGLEDLQRLELLQDEQLAAHLYSVGLGSRVSIPSIDKAIQTRVDALFRPRGRKPLLNQALAAIDQTRKQLASTSVNLDEYQSLATSIDQQTLEVDELRKQLAVLQAKRVKLDGLIDMWPHWQELVVNEAELEGLPEQVLPERGLEQIVWIEQELAEATKQWHKLEQQLPVDYQTVATDICSDSDIIHVIGQKLTKAKLEEDIARERLADSEKEHTRLHYELQVVEQTMAKGLSSQLAELSVEQRKQHLELLHTTWQQQQQLSYPAKKMILMILAILGWLGVAVFLFIEQFKLGGLVALICMVMLVAWWWVERRIVVRHKEKLAVDLARGCELFAITNPDIEIGLWQQRMLQTEQLHKEYQLLLREKERKRLELTNYQNEFLAKQRCYEQLVLQWQERLIAWCLPDNLTPVQAGQALDTYRMMHAFKDRISQLQKQEEQILAQCGTRSVTEIKAMYQRQDRRKVCLEQLSQQKALLATYLGGDLTSRRMELKALSRADLESERDEIIQQIASTQVTLDAGLSKLGRFDAHKQHLEQNDLRERASQSLAIARMKAQDLAEEWASLMACQHLIHFLRQQYETKRQPAVLQDAENYFRTITDGRYRRVFAPVGTTEVRVEDARANVLQVTQLSQGTVEQLYLCLRLALVRNYQKQGIELPIILDDILVNFDDKRLDATMNLLQLVAKEQQILLLTCHQRVLKRCKPERIRFLTRT